MNIVFKTSVVVLGLCVLGAFSNKNSKTDAATAAAGSSASRQAANIQPSTPRCNVTMDTFSRLTAGMSYSTVERILGCEGKILSQSNMAGYATAMVGWDGTSGMWGANMNAMFQNGSLVSKAQFGLR